MKEMDEQDRRCRGGGRPGALWRGSCKRGGARHSHLFSLNVVEKFKLLPLALQAKLLKMLPLLFFEEPLLRLLLHLVPTQPNWSHTCARTVCTSRSRRGAEEQRGC